MSNKISSYTIESIMQKMYILCDANFKKTLNEYLQYLQKENKSILTMQSYLQDLLKVIEFFHNNTENKLLADLPLDIQEYRALLKARYTITSARTQGKFLSSIKSFAKFLSNTTDNAQLLQIVKKIPLPKSTKVHPKPLSLDAVLLLINNTNHSKQEWIVKRDCALWSLLYGQGLRISEALQLSINDVQKDKLQIVGKGNKIRTIPLLDIVHSKLEEYIVIRPSSDSSALFLDIKKQNFTRIQAAKYLKKMAYELGLPDYTTAHKLRHSFVSHLIENKASLKAIQMLVGHAKLSTIENYASVSMEYLAKTHAKAAGKWECDQDE